VKRAALLLLVLLACARQKRINLRPQRSFDERGVASDGREVRLGALNGLLGPRGGVHSKEPAAFRAARQSFADRPDASASALPGITARHPTPPPPPS